jgi:dTDP-4-amino-4,6-dideoxygalactose transaminase
MIQLFNINNYVVDTGNFNNFLHDKIVTEFENKFKYYVGAKYACSLNSATNAIFLSFVGKNVCPNIPSVIPPVVVNAVVTSGNEFKFSDNIDWVGNSYVLHEFTDYKIVDSAQKVEKNQFKKECNSQDLMIFSFYPTKPIGSCDGAMIVSDDWEKIKWFKEMALNGMSYAENNWEREIKYPGFKMYMNSIQAYIAKENFNRLDEKKEKLKEIRDVYNKELGYTNISDHLYRIEVSDNKKFIMMMREKNIVCGIHYEALHLNDVYKELNLANRDNYENLIYPNSEKICNRTVSIPFHENLTLEETDKVLDGIYKISELL